MISVSSASFATYSFVTHSNDAAVLLDADSGGGSICTPDRKRLSPVIVDQYVWFIWSAAFLLAWLAAFAALPGQRKAMLWASIFTTPFGLTEPIFVPAYWSPPSLFDLARTTGFDIESFLFSFGIGGIGAVLYNVVVRADLAPIPTADRAAPAHRLHRAALAIPFVAFPLLYLLPWNPIYPAILAMALGAAASAWCRPELAGKTLTGALLFTVYYVVFLAGLEWTAPGYIARVWNLPALSGVVIARLPLEELLFAAAFGGYWSTVYDHFTWHRLAAAADGFRRRPF